jgi:uncharacterized protein YaaN involved in tellurite resistance
MSSLVPGVISELADPSGIHRVKEQIDLSDRARITSYGEKAQRSVSEFADRVLAQTQNREMGDTGKLLSTVLAKARQLDATELHGGNRLMRMFTTAEARVRRFKDQFETVAGQIDRIAVDLDRNKEGLRRDIALLDELYDQSRNAILELDIHIAAAKAFADDYRIGRLVELKREADAKGRDGGDGMLAAQAYQDAAQALERLEKRTFHLQQARQVGMQQLPQIRIVQAADETLIENLQATAELTIPVWKQKMILLLGLNRQKRALDLQKTVTDATNQMIRQASDMMKQQTVDIERQSQRGIVDVETLAKTNRDLIETVGAVVEVQAEGRKKRAEVEQIMQRQTDELRTALSQTQR